MNKSIWVAAVASVLVAPPGGTVASDRTAQLQEMVLTRLEKQPSADISWYVQLAARDGIPEEALREPRLTREVIARLAGQVILDDGGRARFALRTAARLHKLGEVMAQVDMSLFEGPEREARQQAYIDGIVAEDRTERPGQFLNQRLAEIPTRAVRQRLHAIITDLTTSERLRMAAVNSLQYDLPGLSGSLLHAVAIDPRAGYWLRRAALAHVDSIRSAPGDAEVYARLAADPATPEHLRTAFLDAARVARYNHPSGSSPMAKVILESAPGVPLRDAIDSLDTLKGPDEAALVARLKAIALDPGYDADTRHAAVGAIAIGLGSNAENSLVVEVLRENSSAKLSTVLIKKAGLRPDLWSDESLTQVLQELRNAKDGAVAREAAATLEKFAAARKQAEASKDHRAEQDRRAVDGEATEARKTTDP